MSNISFDDPRLLLCGIPLLLLAIIPFVIAVRRENRNLHNVGAFICSLLVVVAATLALAGLRYDAMITETNVYVLADVSHSSSNNLDVLDGYVRSVEEQLPKNSKMSLIAFGRNYQVLSDMGEEIVSVREATEVDGSATDIAGALRFAGNLFDDDVIKRIVVITDGRETVADSSLDAVVGKLKEAGVYIDVVYLNNTLTEDVNEIQLTGVSYTASTFVDKAEVARLELQSNNTTPTRVYIDVECDGVTQSYAETLYKGQTLVEVPLDTTAAGRYDYTLRVRPENAADDTSTYNNTCLATQTVTAEVKVLFVGGSYEDCLAGQRIYGTENVTYLYDPDEVPFTVEELCLYDEIVLSNFDVRTMLSCQQFVSSLDAVVSKLGKTLTTYGNTYVQETLTEPNATLSGLGGMLPVTMGNPDQDTRFVVLLLDISTSMNFVSRLAVARATASKLMESLNENDMVLILGYAGDIRILSPAAYLDQEAVLDAISSYSPRNGTYLYAAMEEAYKQISAQRFHHREMIILSDGLFNSDDPDKCLALAEEMSDDNIILSALAIHPEETGANALLKNMVYNKNANGRGYYKAIQSESDVDYVLDSVAETMSEVRIEGDNYVLTLRRPQEAVLSGVTSLPAIQGFWYSANKSGATSVVTAKYYRDKLYSLDVPVYSYWKYGNGRVASFLSDISSDWTQSWGSESIGGANADTFFSNLRVDMLPSEQVDSPFLISTETEDGRMQVTVSVSSYRKDAKLTMTVTDPTGEIQTKILQFDSENYVGVFDAVETGRYRLHLTYDYATLHYESDRDQAISYYPEYDSFATYNVASLYRIISENGEVSLDGTLAFDNSDSATRSYTFSFVLPLMVACVMLFVVGIAVRLIRWKDIRSLFVRRR